MHDDVLPQLEPDKMLRLIELAHSAPENAAPDDPAVAAILMLHNLGCMISFALEQLQIADLKDESDAPLSAIAHREEAIRALAYLRCPALKPEERARIREVLQSIT